MTEKRNNYKATFFLQIEATVEETDAGYWSKDPMHEVLANIRRDVPPTIRVYVERGGSGPKLVNAKIKVDKVLFTEE